MADRTAQYKGKSYLLKFMGKTKFGKKAKLAFLDGSKEFWAHASQVTVTGGSSSASGGSSRSRSGAACAECGKRGELVQDLEDGLMKHRRCCDIEPA